MKGRTITITLKQLMLATGVVFAAVGQTFAQQELVRDWPSVIVSPILDTPMRDTAILRGPDGTNNRPGRLPRRLVPVSNRRI